MHDYTIITRHNEVNQTADRFGKDDRGDVNFYRGDNKTVAHVPAEALEVLLVDGGAA